MLCLRASSRTALLRDDFLCCASKSHLSSASSLLLSKMQTVPWFAFWFSFLVATLVAMVFSYTYAVFAARAPAMGNSADRAWQLSQLMEGVSTAFNPSHSSLSCVKTNSRIFRFRASAKAQSLRLFLLSPQSGHFVGAPIMAGHCVSKQIGRHDAACQGCPRCVSRSPEARCFRVVARAVRVSQPAVLSALLVIQLFGIMIPPPYFP